MAVDSQSSQDDSQDSQDDVIEEEEPMESEEGAGEPVPTFSEDEAYDAALQEAIRQSSELASLTVAVGSQGRRTVTHPSQQWRTGCPPWKYDAIRDLLEQLYQETQAKGGPSAGVWSGPTYTGPGDGPTTLTHIRELLKTAKTAEPTTSWLDPRYLQRPLGERVMDMIRFAEKQDVSRDPDLLDFSGVIDDAYRTGIFDCQDIADIIEIWIWQYGSSLLHLPQVLERYILEPLRHFHPEVHVPSLPWFMWRAHPAIPADFRLSLRAWFAQRFGLPSLGVQTAFCSGKYYVADAESSRMILGPTASEWWPGAEDSYMRLPTDWVLLIQKILEFHRSPAVPETEEGEKFLIADIQQVDRRLFCEGDSPILEPTSTPLFRPLRPRDSFLSSILRYNFGLVLPERFRLRVNTQDFPTSGDFGLTPGRWKRNPLSPIRGIPTPFMDMCGESSLIPGLKQRTSTPSVYLPPARKRELPGPPSKSPPLPAERSGEWCSKRRTSGTRETLWTRRRRDPYTTLTMMISLMRLSFIPKD